MENLEKKTRKFINRVALNGVEVGEVGAGNHKVAKFRFTAWDKEKKTNELKFFTMFLTEQSNERNRETLATLGVVNVPAEVTSEAMLKPLPGLGNRVVDLVEEENDAGYMNVKYINEVKFDMKAWPLRAKDGSGEGTPF